MQKHCNLRTIPPEPQSSRCFGVLGVVLTKQLDAHEVSGLVAQAICHAKQFKQVPALGVGLLLMLFSKTGHFRASHTTKLSFSDRV